jgi:hypothetical protein
MSWLIFLKNLLLPEKTSANESFHLQVAMAKELHLLYSSMMPFHNATNTKTTTTFFSFA